MPMSNESYVDKGGPRPSSVWRLVRWLIALVAIAFVAWSVPIRTRCRDPQGDPSGHLTVVRRGGRCIAEVAGADVVLRPEVCGRLTCEPGLVESLSSARGVPLALGLVAYAAGTYFWAIRWRMLLRLARVNLPILSVWRILTEAQAGGVLLPGGVGGDALRVASIVDAGAPLGLALSSTLVERMVGLTTLATVAVVSAGIFERSFFDPLTVVLASIPVGFVLGVTVLRLPAVAHALRTWRFRAFTEQPLAYICDPQAPRVLLLSFLPSLVSGGSQMILVRCLIASVGAVPLHESSVYLGMSMAIIVSAIPALPGGIGTGEAALVFFLGRAGIHPSDALSVSLILRAVFYGHALVGALLSLRRSRAMVATTPSKTHQPEARTDHDDVARAP